MKSKERRKEEVGWGMQAGGGVERNCEELSKSALRYVKIFHLI